VRKNHVLPLQPGKLVQKARKAPNSIGSSQIEHEIRFFAKRMKICVFANDSMFRKKQFRNTLLQGWGNVDLTGTQAWQPGV
jgi:hypothetical protein